MRIISTRKLKVMKYLIFNQKNYAQSFTVKHSSKLNK